MNAEKYNLERIYFGGCFIRGGLRPKGPGVDRVKSLMLVPRPCSDNRHVVVCHTVLEQGQETGALFASRGVLVRANYCYSNSEVVFTTLVRGAIGAWIKNITPTEAEEA